MREREERGLCEGERVRRDESERERETKHITITLQEKYCVVCGPQTRIEKSKSEKDLI